MTFPNKAGDHADTDDILRAELKAAGIPTLQEAEGKPPEYLTDLLRGQSGEVKTSVMGVMYGWTFKRAWYYWSAKGPGIDVETAEALHTTYGRVVRVDGHCGCPSPREVYKGLACGNYHIDSPEGLKALADAIKGLVEKSLRKETDTQSPDFLSVGSRVDLNKAIKKIVLDLGEVHTSKYFYNLLTPELVKSLGGDAAKVAREIFKDKYNAANIFKQGEKLAHLWVLYVFEDDLHWRWELKDKGA